MAALTKELRDYLCLISPYEGHQNYLRSRFAALPFSQALDESRLLRGLIEHSMVIPSQRTTVHRWEEDDRDAENYTEEALVPGTRCVDVPDWFTLSFNGLNYAHTRRRRNLKWIITAVLAPFVLWLFTALLPIVANVAAAWWISLT